MLNTAIRPVQSFNEIKEKKEGSLLLCGVLVLLYYILSDFAGTVRRISLYLSRSVKLQFPVGASS